MHQDTQPVPVACFAPTSPTSPQSSHHKSMSTLSTSPSSVSAEDHYQFVDEADEIVLPSTAASGYYPESIAPRRHPERARPEPGLQPLRGLEVGQGFAGAGLWEELERDGADFSVIPSFILESPPMGPLRSVDDVNYSLGEQHVGQYPDRSLHSLRKGTPHPLTLPPSLSPLFF